MKYFLIDTDQKNHIPYSINRNRTIDIRYANRRHVNKIPDGCVVDMQIPMETFFPDLLTSPLLLTSRIFAEVINMYSPETLFRIIYLLDYESGVYATYHMPFLEEVDCLSDRTMKSHGGTDLIRIILEENKIAGYTHPYVIGRLDFVESILRRNVEAITLEELELAAILMVAMEDNLPANGAEDIGLVPIIEDEYIKEEICKEIESMVDYDGNKIENPIGNLPSFRGKDSTYVPKAGRWKL